VEKVTWITKKQRRAIGERVQAHRHLARLTLRYVAVEVGGVSTATVAAWEQGIVPEPERRAKLAAVLGVDEAKLYREVYEALAARDARARARLARSA
jgi:transcriptional regulator with XRE-family HTH domain